MLNQTIIFYIFLSWLVSKQEYEIRENPCKSMFRKCGDNKTDLKMMLFVLWNEFSRTNKCIITSKKFWAIIVMFLFTISYWVWFQYRVSINGGTPKSSIYRWIFPYKPSILGIPHLWKPIATRTVSPQGPALAPVLHAPHSQKRQMTASPGFLLHCST